MRKQSLWMAMLVVLALFALVACGDDDDDDDGGGAFGSRDISDQLDSGGDNDAEAPASGGAALEDTFDSGTTGYQGNLLDRKIIFTASLDLEAEDVRNAFERASLIARQSGGYVERSSLSSRDASDGETRVYATLTVRVPVTQYDAVLNDVRTMNGVDLLTEESSSTEVTEEYTDLQSRTRNLERTESQYLLLLEQAQTIDEILTVNDRLDGVRSQIEQIQGRLNLLDDLTELATVNMSISPVIDDAEPAVSNGNPSFVDNFAEAWEWSSEALSRLFAGSAYLIIAAMWLVVPGIAAVVVLRATARRRTNTPEPTAPPVPQA